MEVAVSSVFFRANRVLTAVHSQWITWINLYVLLVLVLWSSCDTSGTGQPQVIRSSQPVLASLGDDVILPCRVDPPVNMEDGTVLWTRADLQPPHVYVLQDGRHLTAAVNPSYKRRTTVFAKELQHGNISLKLSGVTLSDQGTYRCFVPKLRSSSMIRLRLDQEVIYLPPRGRGMRVELLPDNNTVPEAISSILWKHAPDITASLHANKAAEWEPVVGLDYYGRFRNRTTLDAHSGRLLIDNMTVEDMGAYSVEINDVHQDKIYVLKEMKRVPHAELVIESPCESNSNSRTLHCRPGGDVTESGVIGYRWKFDAGEWSGPSSWETTIHNNEEGRKVKQITCEINNWFSEEQSSTEYNPLYKESPPPPPARALRHAVIVTAVMVTVALGVLIWYKKPPLTEEENARRRERAAKLRVLLERTPGYLHITDYEEQLQRNMKNTYLNVELGTPTEVTFENVFTPLYNVDIKNTDIHSHHEVRQMEMKKPGEEIQLGQIFKDLSGLIIRTVLTVGCAGIGKTFLVHKFVSDWAKKCFPQDPHLVFPLKFRQLNLLKGQKFTLAQLIHCCITETRFIEEDILNLIFTELQSHRDYNDLPFKVMFVMDGYDENNFHFDFKTEFGLMNVNDSYPVEVLLVNLIKRNLLPSACIWITSRPVAANQIPKKFVNRMTEVRGFIKDEQKEEFFKKTFSDENQARSIFSHIKESKILHTMCEIPVFCWILATVVMNIVRNMGTTVRLPKTMVELFCHFLMGETLREKMKDPALGKVDKEKLIKDAGEVLLKLGRLAFEQLNKGSIIFYEEALKACGLDVNKDLLITDFCTTFFKEDGLFFEKTVYCFVHLSIQEFLAAVYLFHCFTQKNMEVLKTFLQDDDFNSDSSLSDFLKAAMKKALKSKSGHLDLFLRFLHGLSLQSNQSLLGGLLDQTESSPEEIQRAIDNLKKMNDRDFSPDRCINIFHCLMEMNDPSVSQGIQQYLESESSSGKELSETQFSALASMLLLSEEVLDELDLQKYNTSMSGTARLRLIPAVRNCTTARLGRCGRYLKEEHIEVVCSALSSNPSHLRHLDLSSNSIPDPLLDLLCEALKSPHCRLETLRLMNCWLSETSCERLASALRSNPHLRELDLTFNVLPVSGLESFSGLETLKVKHGGREHWTNPRVLTQYSRRLTLDPYTASRTLRLSDDNRKVTKGAEGEELQSYPDHPDRFRDGDAPQVLCTEGLSGGRYLWEVERSGGAEIGVAYRPISRRGKGSQLGCNDQSWSLICSGGHYGVRHNSRPTLLPVVPSDSNRVAVYLDCPAGTLSFYEVSSDSLRHLYTFQTTFTEPLYPGFRLLDGSSSVCLL